MFLKVIICTQFACDLKTYGGQFSKFKKQDNFGQCNKFSS